MWDDLPALEPDGDGHSAASSLPAPVILPDATKRVPPVVSTNTSLTRKTLRIRFCRTNNTSLWYAMDPDGEPTRASCSPADAAATCKDSLDVGDNNERKRQHNRDDDENTDDSDSNSSSDDDVVILRVKRSSHHPSHIKREQPPPVTNTVLPVDRIIYQTRARTRGAYDHLPPSLMHNPRRPRQRAMPLEEDSDSSDASETTDDELPPPSQPIRPVVRRYYKTAPRLSCSPEPINRPNGNMLSAALSKLGRRRSRFHVNPTNATTTATEPTSATVQEPSVSLVAKLTPLASSSPPPPPLPRAIFTQLVHPTPPPLPPSVFTQPVQPTQEQTAALPLLFANS